MLCHLGSHKQCFFPNVETQKRLSVVTKKKKKLVVFNKYVCIQFTFYICQVIMFSIYGSDIILSSKIHIFEQT